MRQQIEAFIAEFHKNRRSKITWITFIAFAIGPLMGGLFMFLMKDHGTEGLSGAFKAKATLMSFTANWKSYLSLLSQVMGVGGVIIFGFVISWVFGREYSDGTAKDLLSLPTSRSKILNAKFLYYALWCLALGLSNLVLGLLIGKILQLPGWDASTFNSELQTFIITCLLTLALNMPIAFFALSGKGYMAPLSIVVIAIIFAQIFGALGIGTYFPWAIPGIYSGSGGEELKSELDFISYLILFVISIIGYISTLLWWKYTDQKK